VLVRAAAAGLTPPLAEVAASVASDGLATGTIAAEGRMAPPRPGEFACIGVAMC